MKIYINRLPQFGAWGGGNSFVKAAYARLPEMNHKIIAADNSSEGPDVLLLVGIDNDGHGISMEQAVMYKNVMEGRSRIRLFMRVNENDARKATTHVDKHLIALSAYVDGTIFVSNWLHDYFMKKGWKCDNNVVIKNGVDNALFRPVETPLPEKPIRIVAHHWSSNVMKGADVYEKIDEFVGKHPDKFEFTYIGRHSCSFKHTKVVGPCYGKKLAEELANNHVYVSASRWDPGPNHVAESISCGLPTYVHRDGGGCVEFAGSDHVYNNWDELGELLLSGCFTSNSTVFSDWNTCIEQYVQFIESTN